MASAIAVASVLGAGAIDQRFGTHWVSQAKAEERAALPSSSGAMGEQLEQQRLAEYIARTFRVNERAVDGYIAAAYDAADSHDVDPLLLIAVMAVESSFNPKARSSAGAEGLMQVHTRVHSKKFKPFGGHKAALNPKANIRVGAEILSGYMDRYGNARGALKAYVGAARLKSDGGYGHRVLTMKKRLTQVARGESQIAPGRGLQARDDRRDPG